MHCLPRDGIDQLNQILRSNQNGGQARLG